MDNDINNTAIYVDEKLNEIDDFKLKIDNLGFKELQDVLNDKWFEKIREDGKLVWAGIKKEYCGEYFPFRWLYEEGQLVVMQHLKNLFDESKSQQKRAIQKKIERISSNNCKSNECTAFELTVISRLYNDHKLKSIDSLIDPAIDQKNADALIIINKQEMFVEITGYEKSIRKDRCGVVDLDNNEHTIIRKITKKHNKQLINAKKPCILIILRPKDCLIDQKQVGWAMDELFVKNPDKYQIENVSAMVFLDSYLFTSKGAYYLNNKSKYPLTEKGIEYIRAFCTSSANSLSL